MTAPLRRFRISCSPALADDDSTITASETIQVTATRLPEDVEPQPSSITVISGEELAARGITDLTEALTLVAGVSAVPGGDGGPAGSVPELWGLKEFDAFLLVVDGVPWGGAFNPALTSLDLNGVERIEVLRGPAPVMYGATSFVGVIHVLHREAGAGEGTYSVSGGSHSSGGVSVATPLPSAGNYRQSIQAGYQKQGFKDDRTDFDRAQLLYRGEADAGGGRLHFDLAATVLVQSPASPHPRQGPGLSALVPLDSNHNPSDAKIDEDRYHLVGGYDRELGGGAWSTTLAYTHTERDVIRGFLTATSNAAPNARGFEQELSVDDVYFESHWSKKLTEELQLVTGFDHLAGKGEVESEIFDYFVPLDGHGAPTSSGLGRLEETGTEDERNFSGLFAQLEWDPTPRFKVEVGLRANRAEEKREAEAEPVGEEPGDEEEEGGEASRTTTQGSGVLGASYLLWSQEDSGLWVFADYRDTFKPSAIDFGPERNTALSPSYTTWSAGIGYRFAVGELRIEGLNLSDERPPVAESEFGDAQYYRLPARSVRLTWRGRF